MVKMISFHNENEPVFMMKMNRFHCENEPVFMVKMSVFSMKISVFSQPFEFHRGFENVVMETTF